MKAIFVLLFIWIIISFFAWRSMVRKIESAQTAEELRQACSGLTIQTAPVRCLQVR